MAAMLKIGFASPALDKTGTLVLFVGSDLDLSAATRKLIGTAGVGSDGPVAGYQPPCSQGPGPKQYTFTIYALSATPAIAASRPGGADITAAVSAITLAQASASVTYTRP